jgi:hypothetical protein
MSNSLVPYKKGSLVDVAGGTITNTQKMAMALAGAQLLILVDCSGSMTAKDAGTNGNQKRHTAAQEVLDILQEEYPGHIAVAAFNSLSHGLVHTGILPSPDGGTPLAEALDFFYPKLKVWKKKFVVVSDGEPNDPNKALMVARKEAYPTYGIYVGDMNNSAGGVEFMRKLAEVTGGKFDHVSLENIKLLTSMIKGYLEAPTTTAAPTAAEAAA